MLTSLDGRSGCDPAAQNQRTPFRGSAHGGIASCTAKPDSI